MAPPVKPKAFQERSSDNSSAVSLKPLVILAKPPDKSKVAEIQSQNTPNSPTGQNELKPPTVLLKTRDNTEQDGSRAASPGITSPCMSQTVSSSAKESEAFADFVKNVSQKVYHIQQKPLSASGGDGDSKTLPPEMATPVKLIDESHQWCDSALEYLHDGNDFYVVGVLGLQGVGKSTVLSAITGWPVFKLQTTNMKVVGEHGTSGIDMFITNQRLILLDTQPLLSPSVMDQMIQYDKRKFFEEKKPLGTSDFYSAESSLYTQSMQQVVFLMSVCHTIITVQDWFLDLNYIRFLLSCEMLKPAKPFYQHDVKSLHDGSAEYYPNLVFIQNKCHRYEFSALSIAKMQKALFLLFQSSNLNFFGSVSPALNHEHQDYEDQNVNLFLLPIKEESEETFEMDEMPKYKGHTDFQNMSKSLSRQVLSMPRQIITHTAASEKNWFHYSARIWDTIKKTTIFDEYRRHIVSIS